MDTNGNPICGGVDISIVEAHSLRPMQKRRILIVDDELDATDFLKRLLERRRNYEVRVENRSINALSTAISFQPDLVLLDMIMPDLDGGDVAVQLRSSDSVREVPIVFISAIAEAIAGFPFLSKPAPLEAVIACIEENLRPGSGEN